MSNLQSATLEASVVSRKTLHGEVSLPEIIQGPAGPAGRDGVSPVITIEDTDTGAILTITDIEGEKTVELKDGEDTVYVGEQEPTGNQNVWINPNGKPTAAVVTQPQMETYVTGLGYLTEEEVIQLIQQELGVIENGSY